MPPQSYTRKRNKFACRGINLTTPPDLLPEFKYPYLQNIRSYEQGTLQTRPGSVKLHTVEMASGALVIHSLRQLNDEPNQLFPLILGVDDTLQFLAQGSNTPVLLESDFSGNPLALIAARPLQSPAPYMYVGDTLKLRKVASDGSVTAMGLAPPRVPANVTIGSSFFRIVDDFDSTAGFTASTGSVALLSSGPGPRVSFTIPPGPPVGIIYDDSSPGWANVIPTTMTDDLQAGVLLDFDATETALVDAVFPAVTGSTIAGITYDSGITGMCTIQFAGPTYGLLPNSTLLLTTGANIEYVRVVAVTTSPLGIPSVRCSTTLTHTSAGTISSPRSFRIYLQNTWGSGTSVIAEGVRWDLSAASPDVVTLTKTGVIDLSYITASNAALTGSNSRPISDEDEIHISIRLSAPAFLTEGQIQLDCDRVTNDFTQNYFFYSFRANDLTPSINQDDTFLTIQQQQIQRGQISNFQTDAQARFPLLDDGSGGDAPYGYYNPYDTYPPEYAPNFQTDSGYSQWSELRFKVSQLTRIGSDSTRGLKDIAAIRISLNITGGTLVDLDAWWTGGSFGPDSSNTAPYNYVYVSRNRETGVVSNPSPPLRSFFDVVRQAVAVQIDAIDDDDVTDFDIYRFGGVLTDFFYIGTVANPGTGTVTFFDTVPDEDALNNTILSRRNHQPFPVLDLPRSGVVNVAGSQVTYVSGDMFNLSWAPGSIMIIGDNKYTLYASPSTTLALELNESAGAQSGVEWHMSEPLLLGQPLRSIFGPFGGGKDAFVIFGCGSDSEPSTLFWTNANNPDAAFFSNRLQVCSPSEPLVAGCLYDAQPYVFSTEKMYRIFATNDPDDPFITEEVANSKGLVAPRGLAVGQVIYFIGKDGIYASSGGQPYSITDEDLYRIFPHDGLSGESITIAGDTIVPPSFTASGVWTQKLAFYKDYLYYDYVDTSGDASTFVYDVSTLGGGGATNMGSGRWISRDVYTLSQISSHYGVEGESATQLLMGGSDGFVYQVRSTPIDQSTAIIVKVYTPAEDQGDSRADKLYGDWMLDVYSGLTSITVTPYLDNYVTALSSQPLATLIRTQVYHDVSEEEVQLARNFGLYLTWTSPTTTPKLFEWEVAALMKVELTKARTTDYDDLGYQGAKWIQGLVMEADTLGETKSITVFADENVDAASFSATHDGQSQHEYSWTPFIAHMVRLVPDADEPWRLYSARWVWEPEPELTTTWSTQALTHGIPNYQHVHDGYISLVSTATVTLTLTIDETDYVYTIASTGGVRAKVPIIFQAIKGKLFQYTFTSETGFRLDKKFCELRVKSWGSSEQYQLVMPFGGPINADGAAI